MKLYDAAAVLRSKNSGPFEITVDALFDHAATYNKIKQSGVINKETISKLYNIAPEEITEIVFFRSSFGI